MTVPEAAAMLRKLEKEKDRQIINGFRRGLAWMKTPAIELFRSKGIGRRVFGQKASGARVLFKRGRITKESDGYRGSLTATGLAGLQELGGRTRKHPIPKTGTTLMAFTTGGQRAFAMRVNHPGAQHPAMPSLPAAAERALPKISEEINKGLQQAVQVTLG